MAHKSPALILAIRNELLVKPLDGPHAMIDLKLAIKLPCPCNNSSERLYYCCYDPLQAY